jgi:hypothetical protein
VSYLGCNPAGVSGNILQQASGNEDRVIDSKGLEKVTVSYGQGQAGKNIGKSDLPEHPLIILADRGKELFCPL